MTLSWVPDQGLPTYPRRHSASFPRLLGSELEIEDGGRLSDRSVLRKLLGLRVSTVVAMGRELVEGPSGSTASACSPLSSSVCPIQSSRDSTPRSASFNHRGYGRHSAAEVIAMVYLCCGGISVELPTDRALSATR